MQILNLKNGSQAKLDFSKTPSFPYASHIIDLLYTFSNMKLNSPINSRITLLLSYY